MTTRYPWHNLIKQGDWLIIEDLEPIKVRTTVAAYVRRHFGPDAIVMTRQIPTGTFICLAYVPAFFDSELADDATSGDPDVEIKEYLDD